MSNWENDTPTEKQIYAIKNMQKTLKEPEFIPDTRGECSNLISTLKSRLGLPVQQQNTNYNNNYNKPTLKPESWIMVVSEFNASTEERTSDAVFLFLMNNFDVTRKEVPLQTITSTTIPDENTNNDINNLIPNDSDNPF